MVNKTNITSYIMNLQREYRQNSNGRVGKSLLIKCHSTVKSPRYERENGILEELKVGHGHIH